MSNRIKSVDIVKAILIIFVIINHANVFDKDNLLFLLMINPAVPAFMVLSGFVYANNCYNETIKNQYNLKKIQKKLIRYCSPAAVYVLIWSMYKFLILKVSAKSWLKELILADWGPGSYYFYLMIQFIFIVPLIMVIVEKYNLLGVIIIEIMTLMWELLCHYVGLSVSLYRIIIFRYMFCIACGIFIRQYFLQKKKINWFFLFISMCVGFGYLFLASQGYEYKLFSYPVWGRTSMMVGFWVTPIIYLICMLEHVFRIIKKDLGLTSFFCTIGRSSYHIMFVQMLLYCVSYNLYNNMNDLNINARICALFAFEAIAIGGGICWSRFEKGIRNVLERKK